MELETNGTAVAYSKAEALMICWNQKGKTQDKFREQRDKLGYELEGYNFGVQKFEIDSVKPHQTLDQRLQEFLQYDDRETLLIIYYGGHGEKNEDNQLVWLRDAPELPGDIRGIAQVNWSALQTLFLHECSSQVLFLLDCCYAGASAHREQSTSTVVALAATGFHDVAPVRGNDSFTTFLTKALNEMRQNKREVSVPYLKTLISSMLNDPGVLQGRGGNRRRVTPDYFPFSDNTITLKVLPVRTDYKQPVRNLVQGNSSQRSFQTLLQDLTRRPSSYEAPPYAKIASQTTPGRQALSASYAMMPPSEPRQRRSPRTPGSIKRTPLNREAKLSPSEQIAWVPGSRTQKSSRATNQGNKYRYSQLHGNNLIRLLGVYPAENLWEPISCYVKNQDITQHLAPAKPGYTALSWRLEGEPQDSPRQTSVPGSSDKISVIKDGSIFFLPIHQSLLKALRQVRDKKDTVILWIDQLCINWEDEEEAKIQVELIPQIFQRASNVFIWLGETGNKSSEAIKFIPNLLNLDLIDSLVKKKSTPEKWQALINLMKRPYFSRRWVFLELILAKRAVLYCGSDMVDWGDFADAVVILGSRYDEVQLLVRAAVNDLDSLMDPRSLAAYSIVEASREHFRRQGDETSLATCDLQTLVSQLPALQSWHPTAVIYALLPLATDHELWTYGESNSPLEVFQQFVMHCTHTSKSLDIICRPWAPKTENGARHQSQYGTWPKSEKLPSWIRQVNHLPFGESSKTGRNNGDLFVGHPNRPYYTAAARSVANPIFGSLEESGKRVLDGSITVSGFVVSEIANLRGRSQGGTLPTDWIKLFEWEVWDKNGKPYPVPDHLWRTLVADRGPGGTSAPLWYHQACRHWLHQYPESEITTDLIRGKKHPSMALEFIQRVRSVIWNRTLFTIVDLKGRQLFGLGPTEAENRDSICVLHGCSVPVVLRQEKDKDYWTLVGECFVYGIMDGEAMQMSEYTSKTQEFLLH